MGMRFNNSTYLMTTSGRNLLPKIATCLSQHAGVGQEKTHTDRGELQDNDHRGDQVFPRHLSGDSESKPSTLSLMTSSADDHSLPPHVATPNTEKSRSHDLGEGRGETMEVESSGLECHDDGNKEVSQGKAYKSDYWSM